jgi:DNA/RNA-binding domain of Phe-tRNA-synthetase-like protein
VSPPAPRSPGLSASEGGFEASAGWCAREVEQELPGLRLLVTEARVARTGPLTGESPRDIKRRLRELSNRYRGPVAVGVRREPIPAAYRIFFRHIGLDPDVTRVPAEAVVVERLRQGGFPTAGLLDDALTLALVETGVPIWALDADTIDGPVGLRLAGVGERLGHATGAPPLPPGRIVLADAIGPLAILFDEIAPVHRPSRRTTTLELLTVRVDGVPSIHVEEALWTCVEALRTG